MAIAQEIQGMTMAQDMTIAPELQGMTMAQEYDDSTGVTRDDYGTGT